jgi:hypothetical protein
MINQIITETNASIIAAATRLRSDIFRMKKIYCYQLLLEPKCSLNNNYLAYQV